MIKIVQIIEIDNGYRRLALSADGNVYDMSIEQRLYDNKTGKPVYLNGEKIVLEELPQIIIDNGHKYRRMQHQTEFHLKEREKELAANQMKKEGK